MFQPGPPGFDSIFQVSRPAGDGIQSKTKLAAVELLKKDPSIPPDLAHLAGSKCLRPEKDDSNYYTASYINEARLFGIFFLPSSPSTT